MDKRYIAAAVLKTRDGASYTGRVGTVALLAGTTMGQER